MGLFGILIELIWSLAMGFLAFCFMMLIGALVLYGIWLIISTLFSSTGFLVISIVLLVTIFCEIFYQFYIAVQRKLL